MEMTCSLGYHSETILGAEINKATPGRIGKPSDQQDSLIHWDIHQGAKESICQLRALPGTLGEQTRVIFRSSRIRKRRKEFSRGF